MGRRNTVLAVDPGASSGWCLLVDGKVYDYGQVSMKKSNSADLISQIMGVAGIQGTGTMVIEGPYKIRLKKSKDKVCPKCKRPLEDEDHVIGWKTYYSMGTSRGRWEQAARRAGMTVEEVNPRTWQAATVGTGARDFQIAKYQARARHLIQQAGIPVKTIPIQPDAAAAVCIGDWWMVKQRIQPGAK